MRYIIIFLIAALSSTFSYSQIHEIGVFVGGSNFIGDIGSTKYIAPNQAAIGGIYKWNRSPRHSFRFTAIFSELEAIDAKSDDPRRKQRGYTFNNSILELSAGIEFTFLDFNLHDSGNKSTPYIYTGVTATSFDNYFYDINGVRTLENTSSLGFGIPMVLGYKTTVTNNLIFALEIGARFAFTDELDGSVPDSENLANLSFGNINNNDWYMFTGVTLTYTFGRKPCYCNF